VRPARNEAGHLVLRRVYRFEFSDDGSRRRAGSIVMLSGEVESLTMEPFCCSDFRGAHVQVDRSTVAAQKRWTEDLFSLKVEADISFEAGQFAKLALAVGNEMVARPYSFVNAPTRRPHEFYYVTLPEGPLTQRLCKLDAGDRIHLAPRPAGFLALSEVPDGENLWMISTGTGIGPFLSIPRPRRRGGALNRWSWCTRCEGRRS